MSIKKVLNTTKKIALLSASFYYANKVISDKLFDFTFKKKEEDFNLQTKYLDWLNSSKCSDEYITSNDGLKLHALKVENHKTNNYIILVHGIWSNNKYMVPYAYEFDRLGYNLLLVNQRASGKSEGNYYTYGYSESNDLLLWTDFLVKNNKKIKIAYFGISMGAATVMMASNKVNVKNVKCIIEDCGYSSLKDQLAHVLKNRYKVYKPYPILNIFEKKMNSKLGLFFNDICPSDALKSNKLPLFVVHGNHDDFVPFNMSKIIYENQLGDKEYFEVDGARHCESMNNQNYFSKIEIFIKKYF